jgi:biuret amidohydrolase
MMTKAPFIDSPQTLPDWIFPWPVFDVDWTRAALLIIDYQNYSSNPQVGLVKMVQEQKPSLATYYVPRITQVTIPNTVRLAGAFRRAGRQVIYTRHGPLLPDGRDMIERRQRRDRDALSCTTAPALWSRGSFEHEVIETLQPQPDDLVIDKNTSSPFNGTGIEHLLRNMNIETLVVTGVATEMCVETTSRDAADRGFNVIVVEDAVATFVEEHHVAALSALARVFTQVWPTDRVLKETAAVG